MRRRVIYSVAVATGIACLWVSASALAFPPAGDRSFQQTYPIASGLCARLSAGTEGKKLKRYAATVAADCAALESSFTAAQSEVVTLRATLRTKIAADKAAIRNACPAVPVSPRPACLKARKVDGASVAALRLQIHSDARSYYRSAESARHRFWTAIHALPGESRLRADAPIPILSS
jgi:hypothetical protein